jgi:hypothetical protein
MNVRIITGIFSLLFLFASSATTAGTLVIDFTGVIMEVESASSPIGLGETVVGHVEIDEADQIRADFTNSGEAEFEFMGLNTFGSASVSSGLSISAAPNTQRIDVYIDDNHIITDAQMSTIPNWVNLPAGFGAGSMIDAVSLSVMDHLGFGEEFGLFAIFEASKKVVDLGADEIVDFDKLFSAAFYVGFWVDGEIGTPPDEWWGVEGVATTATATVVPVPAAVWLFGSGLLGLVGIAKRRRAAA